MFTLFLPLGFPFPWLKVIPNSLSGNYANAGFKIKNFVKSYNKDITLEDKDMFKLIKILI